MLRPSGDENQVPVTIVGGRPPAEAPPSAHVPHGMQDLLLMAAEDGRLRDALVHDRAATLEKCGVLLSDNERKVLLSIPAERLKQMIDRMISPHAERREFLRMAAASIVAFLAGGVAPFLAGRAAQAGEPARLEESTRGIRPDVPSPEPSASPSPSPRPPTHSPTRGIRPDRPSPSPEPSPRPSPPPPTGHRPDVP